MVANYEQNRLVYVFLVCHELSQVRHRQHQIDDVPQTRIHEELNLNVWQRSKPEGKR